MHAVLDRLDDVTDSRSYRAEVLAGLREVLGFDWYAWVGTDPETAVGVDPLASVPDLHELPSIVRLRYGTHVNRWTSLDGRRGAWVAGGRTASSGARHSATTAWPTSPRSSSGTRTGPGASSSCGRRARTTPTTSACWPTSRRC